MVKFTVGITGGSGVGKTTLINQVKEKFEEDITVFSLDNYYLPKDQQTVDENGIINFDLPSALDVEQMEKDLKDLLKGETVVQEMYAFNNPEKDRKEIRLEPRSILMIEGLFVLHYSFIRDVLDYSVYISAPKELQLERRLKRDMEERNYSKEDILYQWNNHVIPSYENYLKPYKKETNLIVKNEEEFDENVDILVEMIQNCLQIQEQ